MLFELDNKTDYLYQWDLNRKIRVLDNSVVEIHFCAFRGAEALVVEVKDGYAEIPNILLQSALFVFVYAFDGNATLSEAQYEVKQRSKPSDYVYTETEIKRYEALDARIAALEGAGGVDLSGIEERIEALENRECEVDLSDYYTKGEVVLYIDNKIGVIANGSY